MRRRPRAGRRSAPADAPEISATLIPVTSATSPLAPPARMMHDRCRHGATSWPATRPVTSVCTAKRMPRFASDPALTAMATQSPRNSRRLKTRPASMGTAVAGNSSVSVALEAPGTAAPSPSATLSHPQHAALAPTSCRQHERRVAQRDAAKPHPGRQPQERGQQQPRDHGGAGGAAEERLRHALLLQGIEHEQRLARHLLPFTDDQLVAPELQDDREDVSRRLGAPPGRGRLVVRGVGREEAGRQTDEPGSLGQRHAGQEPRRSRTHPRHGARHVVDRLRVGQRAVTRG